jgi:tetratricopeptide (TPR) repeat protein
MRRAMVAATLLLAGCGGRTMELPARAPELLGAIGSSSDAAGLSAQVSRLGYSRISVAPGATADYRWTPQAGDRLIMFWRIFTEYPETGADGTRVYRLRKRAHGAPRTLGLDEPPLLAGLAGAGDALARKGKWGEAARAYEKSRRLVPSFPLLHARLGDCSARQGKYREAFESYSRALAMGGPNPDIYALLGGMLEKWGKTDLAIDAMEKSAGLDPDAPARWTALAQMQFQHGKKAPAMKSVDRALALAPADAEALRLKSATGGKP